MNNLKKILNKKGITQKWLSEQLEVTTVTINNWCQNKIQPSLETLEKISKILNINKKELI